MDASGTCVCRYFAFMSRTATTRLLWSAKTGASTMCTAGRMMVMMQVAGAGTKEIRSGSTIPTTTPLGKTAAGKVAAAGTTRRCSKEATAMTPPRPGTKAAGSRRMTHGMMAGRARNGLRRRMARAAGTGNLTLLQDNGLGRLTSGSRMTSGLRSRMTSGLRSRMTSGLNLRLRSGKTKAGRLRSLSTSSRKARVLLLQLVLGRLKTRGCCPTRSISYPDRV
ncbi:unnamed protein product [Symbiodinium necroappetens]|uniref:Uncharacterized protein n=1 Tax=Symbiodinium necroappetens TaxID=1628268 RepID=A0A812MB07_9DINO|nr:unnamed protein product [Symbiodinium necroappetens]